jgi:hypothetical protein
VELCALVGVWETATRADHAMMSLTTAPCTSVNADYPDFLCQGVPFDDDLAQSQICADGIQTGSIGVGAGLMQ